MSKNCISVNAVFVQIDYLPPHLNVLRKEGEMAEWNGIDG
jgi:hypothetical protein